ncbi:MAG: sodium:solute symporter family protein [Fimbriimonadaceae bacterium]
MVALDTLDAVIIGLFILLILALGFSARLRQIDALQFIAAGRSLTLPVFVATLVSTWYGGILGIGESVQYYGLGTILLLGVPYYVFALLYALVFAKRVRGAEQISIPERLAWHYGKPVALIGAVLVFLLGVPAAHVLMLGVLTEALTGWAPLASLLFGTVIGTLFLYRGGLLADARISLLAFVMMYVGFAVIAVYCLVNYPPGQAFASLQESSPALFTFDGGVGILTVTSFLILGAWTLIDPGFHQRVASARDEKTGQKGVLVGILFWMIFDLLSVTTGMYALALGTRQTAEPLLIFPLFGDEILPSGLKAVFFCGMMGTIVSAMVGYALVSGSTIGREIYGRLKGVEEGAAVVTWSRIGIAMATLVAIGLALMLDSVVALWYSWGGAVVGALLIPVSLAYGLGGRFKFAPGWIAASMVVSFMVSFIWLVAGTTAGNEFLLVTLPGGDVFGLGTLIPGLGTSAIVLGVSRLFGSK